MFAGGSSGASALRGGGIAFSTTGKLPERIYAVRSATWSPDGKWIAFTSGRTFGRAVRYRLYRIRATGGTPRRGEKSIAKNGAA